MEKLKTCKYKEKKLFQPLPQKQYEDVDTYIKYLRLQDIRKSVPLGTGLLSGTLALGSLYCGMSGFLDYSAIYAYSACFALLLGFGTGLICYTNELSCKSKLLKENEQENQK